MLRACVLAHGAKWEDCLPFVEFYTTTTTSPVFKWPPFEVLYGRKCRTPLNWSETGEGLVFGPEALQEAENKVQLVQEN